MSKSLNDDTVTALDTTLVEASDALHLVATQAHLLLVAINGGGDKQVDMYASIAHIKEIVADWSERFDKLRLTVPDMRSGQAPEVEKSADKRIPSCETENRAAQLSSLLVLLYGNGQEEFESLFPRDRDNILWLASDLACAIDREINFGERV